MSIVADGHPRPGVGSTDRRPALGGPRVSVVIPALNEAKNLERLLPTLPDGLFEVIVVDGASTDGTIETARRIRPDVRVVYQSRRGKGNAMACGFVAARGDIIVTLDADGSADPAEIERFVDVLVAGADFAKGSRGLPGGGSDDLTVLRGAGNRALSTLVNRLYGSTYTDLCYGYNAFWAAACLPALGLDTDSPAPDGGGYPWGDGFEIETLLYLRVAQAGLKVVEVPSHERSRVHGVSNLNAPRDGMRVLRTILAETRRAQGGATVTADMDRAEPAAPADGDPPVSSSEPASPTLAAAARVMATTASTSVIVCAYNDDRWPAITRAIASLQEQTIAPGEVILVVDHNEALLERATQSFPDVTVIASEYRAGLSGARNSGLRAASGDIVAFLDDDAVAAPTWLAELLVEFEQSDVLGVGGMVDPLWPESASAGWLPEEFYWTVGCSYRGLAGHGVSIRNPIGANMAFRRELIAGIGGFSEDLGRVGGFPAGCEETELAIRLRQAMPDGRIVQTERARVRHEVDDARLRLQYFVTRCWAEGLSKAAVESSVGRDQALASERGYVAHTLPAGVARGLGDALQGAPAGLARAGAIGLGLTATVCGYAVGRSRVLARRHLTGSAQLAESDAAAGAPATEGVAPGAERDRSGRLVAA